MSSEPSPTWGAWRPAIAVMAVGVAGYLLVYFAVTHEVRLWALDDPVLEYFAAHRTETLDALARAVSTLFGAIVLPVLVAVGAAIWGWRTGQWFNAAVVTGSMIVAGVLSLVLKELADRPRPPETYWQEPDAVQTSSFPSGHTLCAATLVLVTGYLAWRTERSTKVLIGWSAMAVVVIGLVAWARLYAGYHFVTDVVAGFFAALVVLGLAMGIVRTRDLRLDSELVTSESARAN